MDSLAEVLRAPANQGTAADPVCELMVRAMAAEPTHRPGPIGRRRRRHDGDGAIAEAPAAEAAAGAITVGLVDAVSEAVVATVDGRIVYVNPAAERLYGWSARDALGRTAAEVVTWDLLPHEVEALLTPKAAAHTWSGEVGLRQAPHATVLLTVKPLLADGRTVAMAAVARDVSDRQAAHRAAEQRSRRDDLTGLPNRRALVERLDALIATDPRVPPACALIRIEVRDLRLVNDAFGHDAANEAVAAVARALQAAAHPGDLVARTGTSSFAVGCPHLQVHDDPVAYADDLRGAVATPGGDLPIHRHLASCAGVAVQGPGTTSADELLQHADIALTHALDGSRARSLRYDENLHRQLIRQLQLEAFLREAITAQRVDLAYQPILRLEDQRVMGAEALLRMEDGDGPIPAGELIEVAERTGLIRELGDLILRTACAEAARWQRLRPDRRLGVSVNVSAVQLDDDRLPERVEAALEAAGLAAERLTLEMTETVLMADTDRSVRQLARLQQLGVHLSADDFGTGYSSLAYLKRFPLDAVKADLSFVAGLPGCPEDSAVVSAIIALADAMHLQVVAEGVEEPCQLQALLDLGCGYGQGWLWSRAVPADEFLRFAFGAAVGPVRPSLFGPRVAAGER